ncbi:MAG: ATP-dependent nuclease [Lachnospira sp.]
MRILELEIKNFKSVNLIKITDIDMCLILVGCNNSGKSTIMDAIRAVTGDYKVTKQDFHSNEGNISIKMKLGVSHQDLEYLQKNGVVSKFKHFELWKKDFHQKIPSFKESKDGGTIEFEYIYGRDGVIRYRDGFKKNSAYIKQILPKIYFVDHYRNCPDIKDDLKMLEQGGGLASVRDDRCMFDSTKRCTQCFDCIGVINKKRPEELSLVETGRLFQYKLFNVNLNNFADRLNYYFKKNGAKSESIRYEIRFDADRAVNIETIVSSMERGVEGTLNSLSEGLRSIYILSLLETYVEMPGTAPYIILVEEPETYLHPQLQKFASEILYRLSKKNQVIFSTHEPEMLFNFTTKQIRQIYKDSSYSTSVNNETDIDDILNDLGFTANDLMNVSFVFIVEGKQDRSRLPLLLNKYYSEIHDDYGNLRRIAILATNSCTNIKTYANLKYINTIYLKDQFMMIRDSDGKDKELLGRQLCKYYGDRAVEDKGNLPRVTDKNVLILKYYSFENYFLFPQVMTKIGVVNSEDEFYDILWDRYQEYLYRLSSVKKMQEKLKINIKSRQDIIDNIENIRIYVRGHNLFDIFYGKYKKNENEILTKYIQEAPRSVFADILDKIDEFVYFDSRKLKNK